MAIEIEADMYSGRRNPRWLLSPAEVRQFLQQVGDRAVPINPIEVVEEVLGYRGFIVRASGAEADALRRLGISTTFRVRHGLESHAPNGSATEVFLSTSAGTNLDDRTGAALAEATQPSTDVALSTAASCSLAYTSATDFTFWNGDRKPDNNCYNYAANYASNTFAQPGRQSGQVFSSVTVSSIRSALIRDGWVDSCAGSNLFIALVIDPGSSTRYPDFHFYRKNLDGSAVRWCHKPGSTAAKNKDNSGNFITDPKTCNRGYYTTWGGLFYSNGVRSRVVR